MLLTTRINHLTAICPQLSRVWIKTGDPRIPLKGVWIDESQLHRTTVEASASPREAETSDLTEDHLPAAALIRARALFSHRRSRSGAGPGALRSPGGRSDDKTIGVPLITRHSSTHH